jgi:D-xylulose reductase
METLEANPSCLLYNKGDARYENRPMPTIEDPLDVIIRIAYVGVCGSDVRLLSPTI